MCHLSNSRLINYTTQKPIVLLCSSKPVAKEEFEKACVHSEAKHSLVLPTVRVFLMLQVTFLPHRLNVFLHINVPLLNDGDQAVLKLTS